MKILHDPATLKHKTIELLGARLIPALESPERIKAILKAVATDKKHEIVTVDCLQASNKQLLEYLASTHAPGYLRHLKECHNAWVVAGHITEEESILPECFPTFAMPHRDTSVSQLSTELVEPVDIFARSGFYAFDMSTGVMKDTYAAVLASANLAVECASRLLSEPDRNTILALCRPPGHHCDTKRAGGYCYVNNCVLTVTALLSACQHLQSRDVDLEVAILDIDMHHGNGTQSFFYDRKVRYVSMHGKDEYPYFSGGAEERGSAAGYGYNHNMPLLQKTPEQEYLSTLNTALDICLEEKPRFLVLSLGFDTYHLDPLGGFDLDTASYEKIGKLISERTTQKHIQTAILLEGGYVIDRIGENLLAFLAGWDNREST